MVISPKNPREIGHRATNMVILMLQWVSGLFGSTLGSITGYQSHGLNGLLIGGLIGLHAVPVILSVIFLRACRFRCPYCKQMDYKIFFFLYFLNGKCSSCGHRSSRLDGRSVC